MAEHFGDPHDPIVLAVGPVEAGRRLGVGRSTIYELILTGELASFTIGRRRLIPAAALERLVAERTGR
jgi:excisionase family DNA binding protein